MQYIEYGLSAPGQPTSISDDSEAVSLVGTSQDLAREINQEELHWGLLEDSVEERMEKALSDSDKTEVEGNKEGDPEEINKKRTDGKGVRHLKYKRAEQKLSDHRPVSAVFMVEMEVFCHRKLHKALS